jgi:putative transposase
MTTKPLPKRRSVRKPGHNYAGPGTVFITICTNEKRDIFGTVTDDTMHLSPVGQIAHDEWVRSFQMRSELVDLGFIVMPNHMHAMFVMAYEGDPIVYEPRARHRHRKSLASIVAGYKAGVTGRARRETGEPALIIWQRGFHDVIVESSERFDAIAAYIPENPRRWFQDKYNSEPQNP